MRTRIARFMGTGQTEDLCDALDEIAEGQASEDDEEAPVTPDEGGSK